MGLLLMFCFIAIFCFPSQKYSNETFGIERYYSLFDKDQDGIDDQTDILMSAKEYLKTKPKYQSKYYGSGYPNDAYGVCTDVVAFALLGAGYDIKELLHEDVISRPLEYDIEVIDKNIDFRRVSNLQTYFLEHAISLTTDIHQIFAWQGGDIVVFKKHIGIVSDARYQRGIPFLFHHAHTFQISYEEDVLEDLQEEIIGHFRIS